MSFLRHLVNLMFRKSAMTNRIVRNVEALRPFHHSFMHTLLWLWRRELPVLLGILGIFGSLTLFASLTELVTEDSPHELDRYLLLLLRNPSDLNDAIGPQWLEEVGRDITALGGNVILFLVTLAVLGYLLFDQKPRLALVVLIATFGALAVSSTLKATIDRDRPDVVPHHSVVYTASFPSGHSMLSASTYLTLGALLAATQRRKRIKFFILFFCLFITFLVGLSRIYLGVHWPSDVLAGWTAGAAWATLCWLIARWLQSRNPTQEIEG